MSTYHLPDGWTLVKLGDVVDQVKDRVTSGAAAPDVYVPGGSINRRSYRVSQWLSVDDGLMGPAFHMIAQPGDVLYKSRVPHGVAVADRTGICANTTYVLRTRDGDVLLQEFIPHVLSTSRFLEHESLNDKGSTNLYLNFSDVAKYEFALPPIGEQQQILGLMQALDSARHRTRGLPTDVVRRAAITEFAHRWRREIGLVKLSDVCDLYQPKTISTAQMHDSGKFPVFGANGQIGRYHEFNHAESEVAITCRGATCGTVNMTPPMAWITGNSMVVRPKDSSVRRDYLFAVLKFGTDLRSSISGTAQPQITRRSLAPTELVVPAPDEQQALCRMLDEVDRIDLYARESDTHLTLARQALLNEMLVGGHVQ